MSKRIKQSRLADLLGEKYNGTLETRKEKSKNRVEWDESIGRYRFYFPSSQLAASFEAVAISSIAQQHNHPLIIEVNQWHLCVSSSVRRPDDLPNAGPAECQRPAERQHILLQGWSPSCWFSFFSFPLFDSFLCWLLSNQCPFRCSCYSIQKHTADWALLVFTQCTAVDSSARRLSIDSLNKIFPFFSLVE